MRFAAAILLIAAATPASPAAAKEQPPIPTPAVITQLMACRSVADSAQRLACYDREVAAMNEAQQKGDLVTMDKQHVRKTRKSLFGLALPDLGVFGDDSDEGAKAIETTIKSTRQGPDGKWTFTLVEGGRWVQLDTRNFVVDPKAGDPIRIRRAALGSYLANVNKQIAIRVRRIQ